MNKNYKEALARIQEAKEKNLDILDLSRLELTEVPEEVFELTDLTELNLSGNELTSIPEAIGKLTRLISLYLQYNHLYSLPKNFKELTNLNKLHIGDNEFKLVPEVVGKLINLTSLYLRGNKLIAIPKFIEKLVNLKHLNIHDNKQISIFPTTLLNLTNLRELYFGGTNLSIIPKTLNKLINLEKLDLGHNKLHIFPSVFSKLTKLTLLRLGGNNFDIIPSIIGKLDNLEHLNLSYNRLTFLPKSTGNLTKLISLELDSNKLTSIPEEIDKLTELTQLILHNNQLIALPKGIEKLTNLDELNLRNNQLTSLPKGIKKLTNLSRLSLEGNQFKVGPEIYELEPKEQIQAILKWQRAQEAGTLQPIHEAKVIFIGESNYGKTHLIELLKEGKIDREINTTHGIERSQVSIPHTDKDIQLNIWDLGGQEFMRSTHQFFFSERTLYVLVTLARRERKELNHWLKLVNQLGNKAPVLVVINKIDIDAHDLDRKSLERDYPNIIGFVRTCINDCKDGIARETLALLKKKISETVSDKTIMPSVFEQRPPEWFTVKEELEKLEAEGTDFITYKEYEDLEFIKNLPEDERKTNLKLLSMIGAVVSFVDDPRLIDTNVINPQWIMDGVYAIINDPKVKDKAKGKLHINDLARILPSDKFPKARHAYLLELMEKFSLCYPAKDQRNVYFIPDLFEDIEPDVAWNSEESMHFRYNYDDFSPDAFMTRFIVEMHQDIQDDNRWRSGVYISNGSCQAKVYQTYRKNFINIEIIGNELDRRSYLYTIRDTFRKLHEPFPQMQIQQEVSYKEYWLDYLELSDLEAANEPKYHTRLKERLPITDILNGYTSRAERKGNLKIVKIFLASSAELKAERGQFEIFIRRENNTLVEQGVFLKLALWEDSIDAMAKTNLQSEYNKVVKHSDIFVSLFFTKVGPYTLEEFETAFGQFKETGKPLVYTYFKNAAVQMEDINDDDYDSLRDFKKKLKDLGHFRTIFKNTEDLQLQFKRQLANYLIKLKW